jgi:hypothetical protein
MLRGGPESWREKCRDRQRTCGNARRHRVPDGNAIKLRGDKPPRADAAPFFTAKKIAGSLNRIQAIWPILI